MGDYVRELLSKAGVSQREAARRLGVSERTMRHYVERGAPYTVQFCLEALAGVKPSAAGSRRRAGAGPSSGG